MIIDLQKYVAEATPYWQELESLLEKQEDDIGGRLKLEEAERFHYLYQRASADLSQICTFTANQELRAYLEGLVGRAYTQVHADARTAKKFSFKKWFFVQLPQTFRRHFRAFLLSLLTTLLGAAFGATALAIDSETKSVLMPFGHLHGSPSDRVAEEEQADKAHMDGVKLSFATQLMTHNIRVSITVLVLGITFGFGSLVLLFYNGVILGAVCFDYIVAGESVFLAGWLLPHGSIEIPAILIAGQAGLILGGTLLRRDQNRQPLSSRLRSISGDLSTLIGGTALLLIWAGIIESFFSQYHHPIIPYSVKIAFGSIELLLFVVFFYFAGRSPEEGKT